MEDEPWFVSYNSLLSLYLRDPFVIENLLSRYNNISLIDIMYMMVCLIGSDTDPVIQPITVSLQVSHKSPLVLSVSSLVTVSLMNSGFLFG